MTTQMNQPNHLTPEQIAQLRADNLAEVARMAEGELWKITSERSSSPKA